MNIEVQPDIKEAIVDELLRQFRIDTSRSRSLETTVENIRGMLDDAANDDVEILLNCDGVRYVARLELQIDKGRADE